MQTKSSEIELDEKTTTQKVLLYLVAAACFGVSIYCGFWMGDGLGWGLAAVALIVALGFFGTALTGKSSPCPECGTTIENVFEEINACKNCGVFVRTSDGFIAELEASHVDEDARFKTRLPEEFHWPQRCCLCPEDVSSMREFSIDKSQTGRNLLLGAAGLAAGQLIVRTGGGFSGSIQVPYCETCDDGVNLDKKDDNLMIGFKNYGFYCEFRELNDQ